MNTSALLIVPLLVAGSLVAQNRSSGLSALVINEFSYDDTSTDDVEFVEIYNRSGGPVDMTGWVLESRDPSGLNFSHALSPVVLAAGDYWVLGFATAPNVDQIVAGPVAGWLENDNESITLLSPGAVLADTLIYEANKGITFGPTLAEGEGIWDNHTLTQTAGNEMSWARVRDGWDNDNNGMDFAHLPWTPGASNNLSGQTYFSDFDALGVGANVPGWIGNFKAVRAIDPTVVGPLLGANNLNPNAIPASPQGGNAAIYWDETGGGNTSVWLGGPGIETSFEAWVYLAPSPVVTAGQAESWSIGIQGSTGLYNIPDPSGSLGAGFIANGNTGFSWTYQALNAGSTNLYLIDHLDGGWGASAISGPTILATIPIVTSVNDGWQRLLISTNGTTLTARFGGTLGNPDGTLYTFPVTPFLGGVFVGYRELVTANATLRPVTMDAVSISNCPPATADIFGTGTPTSLAAVPQISVNGMILGSPAADVYGMNLVPNSSAIVLVGIRSAPVDLTGAGAQPGSNLYLLILDYVGVPTDGTGLATFTLSVPNSASLCGADFSWQWLQIDGSLPYSLPIAMSAGMTTRLGL
ncbi:MAG: lamin tail domain-containing protein [Planctomycetes bacterium]|nr:lamin tail domain-containing protein [Planctomycetota bacterium]